MSGAPTMHSAASGVTEQACDTCGTLFTPKRGWSRFCTPRCRNVFHAVEARKDAIRARALELYAALVKISSFGEGDQVTGSFDEPHSATIAREALDGLKPPVEPKALLEKAKA